MSDIVMYNLGPSPNNQKVRIALNYKGIPYEAIPVDFADRSNVIEASGQPLTPVIKHGDTVVYDSRAILRYLDNNFRDTPKLFSEDRDTMMEIERLENDARSLMGECVSMVFRQVLSESPDLEVCEKASRMIHERTADYEERLQDHDFLMGDEMNAVDVTAAPLVFLGMLPPQALEMAGDASPIVQFFIDNFDIGEGREKTREWAMRVIAYDR